MESSFKDIPRLGETKIKPRFGEVRLTIDGTRRKIFDGKCWQYLCTGDPKCLVQARTRCRFHKYPTKIDKPKQRFTQFKHRTPEYDEMETQPNGNRRVWKGTRWHGLCREEGCRIQARDFCKTHLDQRNALQNTNEATASETRMPLRSQSLTLDSTSEPKEEQKKAMSTSLVNPSLSPEFETTIKSSPQQPARRRRRCRRRRRRSLNSISRDPPMTRRSQRLNESLENADIQSTNEIEQTNSKKRKLSSDTNNEEHIVPKRKLCGGRDGRRKYSNRSLIFSLEPTSSNASISDIPPEKKSISSDCEASLCLKPNRLHASSQSVEIPVQAPSPLNLDSSTSAILEQFGMIIKKETIIDEESLICVPSVVSTNSVESPCETLQDFLRAEEIKNKEFKLDCQRISYRLAKIQDCIGSLSSITT